MATILEFRGVAKHSKSAVALRQQAAGEVVIFPGVRYERWADAPLPQQQGRGTRYDRLDLLE